MSVRNIVRSIQDIMRQDVGVDGDAQRISQLCWMFFLKIIDDQDQELEQLSPGYRSPLPKKLQWRAWAADPEGATGEELLAFINGELFPTLKELPAGGKPGDRRRVVRDVFEDAYNHANPARVLRGLPMCSTRFPCLISTRLAPTTSACPRPVEILVLDQHRQRSLF